MSNTEIWKNVISANEMYQVSNMGNVRSVDRTVFDNAHFNGVRKKGRVLRQQTYRGYKNVCFFLNNKKQRRSVHRLVAEAFIPNFENKPCIDHIDGNPANNCVENLRWATYKENQNNPITVARISNSKKGRFGQLHNTSKPIVCVETGYLYWGAKEAQRELGVCHSAITDVLKGGRHKTAGGYHWRYATANEINMQTAK